MTKSHSVTWSSNLEEIRYFVPQSQSFSSRVKEKLENMRRSGKKPNSGVGNVTGFMLGEVDWDELFERAKEELKAVEKLSHVCISKEYGHYRRIPV